MNSNLISYTKMSPNNSGKRTTQIQRITIHCVVGQLSVETLGAIFANAARKASSNYGIGKDGRVALYVNETNRSWCSSSEYNDQRAITIECASDAFTPYAFNSVVYNKLIELCVDICKRNNKKRVVYFEDKTKALNYKVASDELLITLHRWFAKTACPGEWLIKKLPDLVKKINDRLENFKPYKVRVSVSNLNIRKGAGTNTKAVGTCPPGLYTIIEEKTGRGATLWGKLKSGAGWLSLDYVDKL